MPCRPSESTDRAWALPIREMAERLGRHGVPRDHVSILLRESPPENWGSGGVAASDYDLGFELNV